MNTTTARLGRDLLRADASPAPHRLGDRSAALGVTLLATCLCQVDRIVFGVGAAGMLGTRLGANLYTGLFGLALALVLVGLVARTRRVAAGAAVGVAGLGLGLAFSPPSVMHGTPPTAMHLAGFTPMIAGAAALVWAFLRAYPTRRQGAACTAAGGLGAALGCSCCVTSGAFVGFAVALGATMPEEPFYDGIPYALFMSIAVYGLWRLAGRRYALVALAGAVLAFGGDEGLKPLMDGRVELLARLVVSTAGIAVVVWAFARAFATTRRPAEPVAVPVVA